MNSLFLKIASGVFAILFVMAIIPLILDMLAENGRSPSGETNMSVNLSSYSENSVDRIAMKQKDTEEVVLEKSGENWNVGANVADAEKVKSIFESFANLEIREMVSKNESNFSKFGVTKEEGIRLVIREKSGKEQVFYAGKIGAIPQEFFFRKDGIKNTYSVRGTLRELLVKDASYWKKTEETKSATEKAPNDTK